MLQSGKPECGASFFEYHTTVPLKTIHTIFNSPLYEGTQLITYTQENCTRLPAKDNCLFAFTAREEASRLEGERERERERERLFRDKSNNRGNGLWLIDRGCVLFSRRSDSQEGTRCLLNSQRSSRRGMLDLGLEIRST